MAVRLQPIHVHRRDIPSLTAYVVLALLALFFLIPFVWLILASINPSATFAVEFPKQSTLDNFRTILTDGLVKDPFKNSAIIAFSTMFLTIALAGLAAYTL